VRDRSVCVHGGKIAGNRKEWVNWLSPPGLRMRTPKFKQHRREIPICVLSATA
jgi:hypothetical protein